MRNVMASAAEAETGGLFVNGQAGQPIIITLEEMGHKQPGPTPICTDNTTADGIANETVKAKRTKAMDMRFYWIIDRVRQGQCRAHWKRGTGNLADYFTKHHPPAHHIEKRPDCVINAALELQCLESGKGVLIGSPTELGANAPDDPVPDPRITDSLFLVDSS